MSLEVIKLAVKKINKRWFIIESDGKTFRKANTLPMRPGDANKAKGGPFTPYNDKSQHRHDDDGSYHVRGKSSMVLEKIADAISVLRRASERSLKRNSNSIRSLELNNFIKNSKLNRSDAVRSFLTDKDKGSRPAIRFAKNSKEEYKNVSKLPKNIVYRGEVGNTGAGSESTKYHDIDKLQNKSKSHIYFTPNPERSLKSTHQGGIDEKIKYTKVNENRTVSEDELSNRRNPFFEHENNFVKLRHEFLHDTKYKQYRKNEQYSYSQLKNLKQKQNDIETGKKLKDYKPNSFRSPEMFLNKNLHDIKTLKKHVLPDDRSAWKTEDGKTVMTKGIRLSDMFRPSN